MRKSQSDCLHTGPVGFKHTVFRDGYNKPICSDCGKQVDARDGLTAVRIMKMRLQRLQSGIKDGEPGEE